MNLRLKEIDETINNLLKGIKHNELLSKKHKDVCMTLNCVEHLLILASTVTGCVFISTFAYLVGIPVGIENSAVG